MCTQVMSGNFSKAEVPHLDEEKISVARGIVVSCSRMFKILSPEERRLYAPYLLEGKDVGIKIYLLFNYNLWNDQMIDLLLTKDLDVIGSYLRVKFHEAAKRFNVFPGNFGYFMTRVINQPELNHRDDILTLVEGYGYHLTRTEEADLLKAKKSLKDNHFVWNYLVNKELALENLPLLYQDDYEDEKALYLQHHKLSLLQKVYCLFRCNLSCAHG